MKNIKIFFYGMVCLISTITCGASNNNALQPEQQRRVVDLYAVGLDSRIPASVSLAVLADWHVSFLEREIAEYRSSLQELKKSREVAFELLRIGVITGAVGFACHDPSNDNSRVFKKSSYFCLTMASCMAANNLRNSIELRQLQARGYHIPISEEERTLCAKLPELKEKGFDQYPGLQWIEKAVKERSSRNGTL